MDLTDLLSDFATWAWDRHHNIWSWYIRFPLFLVFCFFAYRRSWWGVWLSLVALLTSMFWFPAPERIDPQVQEFLDWQASTLSSPTGAIFFLALTAASLALVVYICWQRRWRLGLVLVNLYFVYDLGTGLVATPGDPNLAVLSPTLTGLALLNGLALALWLRRRRQASTPPGPTADHQT